MLKLKIKLILNVNKIKNLSDNRLDYRLKRNISKIKYCNKLTIK
jgi:hypothetical protein